MRRLRMSRTTLHSHVDLAAARSSDLGARSQTFKSTLLRLLERLFSGRKRFFEEVDAAQAYTSPYGRAHAIIEPTRPTNCDRHSPNLR